MRIPDEWLSSIGDVVVKICLVDERRFDERFLLALNVSPLDVSRQGQPSEPSTVPET
jgi:hypothetical protein